MPMDLNRTSKGTRRCQRYLKQKVKEACNHTGKGDECPVHGTKDCATVKEEAPKGKKYARMVKHIKKNYPKDKEGIAYATAWKHKKELSWKKVRSHVAKVNTSVTMTRNVNLFPKEQR